MKILNTLLASAVALTLMASAAVANPTEGPQEDYNYVVADGTTYYDVWFNADEVANVDLVGECSGAQDIDLWVYDENGNEIVKSTSNGCYETVVFEPLWTGRFRVVVENRHKPYDTWYQIDVY